MHPEERERWARPVSSGRGSFRGGGARDGDMRDGFDDAATTDDEDTLVSVVHDDAGRHGRLRSPSGRSFELVEEQGRDRVTVRGLAGEVLAILEVGDEGVQLVVRPAWTPAH